MRTFRFLLVMTLPVLLFAGCMKEDIDELRAQQAENAARIAALEAWQQTVNSNIIALQGLVAALQDNDYVMGVVPFTDPSPGGTRVTFTKSGEVIIWNGAKGDKGDTGNKGDKGDRGDTGAAGHSPAIGVAQFPDGSGVYYWTLDGEFIESGGQKIPVTGDKGNDGQDGVTPKLAIGPDGFWYISPDGEAAGTPPGAGWENTNVYATGPIGPQGPQGIPGPQGIQGEKGEQGDAIFAKDGVDNDDPDYVVFTLVDGTKLTVPKYKTVGISFEQPGTFIAGTAMEIAYISEGTAEPTNIRIVDLPAGWKYSVDYTGMKITVTPAAAITPDNGSGEATVLVGIDNNVAGMYALTLKSVSSDGIGAVYYENGVATGLVYIANDGTSASGRVVSLAESYLQYSDASYATGAEFLDTGIRNMEAVKNYIEENDMAWANFPAFEWVHSMNDPAEDYADAQAVGVWFLPAREELILLSQIVNSFGWNDFNDALEDAGGPRFGDNNYYNCSNNSSNGLLYALVRLSDGFFGSNLSTMSGRERAIVAF